MLEYAKYFTTAKNGRTELVSGEEAYSIVNPYFLAVNDIGDYIQSGKWDGMNTFRGDKITSLAFNEPVLVESPAQQKYSTVRWINSGYNGILRHSSLKYSSTDDSSLRYCVQISKDAILPSSLKIELDQQLSTGNAVVLFSWSKHIQPEVKNLLKGERSLLEFMRLAEDLGKKQDADYYEISLHTNMQDADHGNSFFTIRFGNGGIDSNDPNTQLTYLLDNDRDKQEETTEIIPQEIPVMHIADSIIAIMSLIPIQRPGKNASKKTIEIVEPGKEVIMQDLITYLRNKSISTYDMVDYCRSNGKVVIDDLIHLMLNSKSAYVRLCSAWSLGLISDKTAFPVLKDTYQNEVDGNTRANMVWALFMIDPEHIDEDLFSSFLVDGYHIIPLIALRRLSGMAHLQGKYDFLDYYRKQENILVRLEFLRRITSFVRSEDISGFLKNQLGSSDHPLIKAELINSIGAINRSDSIDILIEYYSKYKDEIDNNDLLAYSVVNAILSLSQSKAFPVLQDIYAAQTNTLIKWKIIEALSSSGGPNSLSVLKNIYDTESDPGLKDGARQFIAMVNVTTE